MARWHGVTVALCLSATLTCAPPDVGTVSPRVTIPTIKIGLPAPGSSVTVGGGSADLMLSSPDGTSRTAVAAGTVVTLRASSDGLRVGGDDGPALASLTLTAADSGGLVRFNGRDYRGEVTLAAGASGVAAVNVLEVESYLRGVVGAEMGRRTEQDLAALMAQAIVSRTLALKSIGKWRLRGYDLMSTVADQAYAGAGFEYPLADEAVRETAGEVLAWQGGMIDIFFHSTCGGRTAPGEEVFVYAARPYLRSVPDVDEAGRAWCAISPRYHWKETWSGEGLVRALRATLPAAGGTAAMADDLRDFRILERTGTGRVSRLEVVGRDRSIVVTGPQARLLLRTGEGSALRSANFTLQVAREGPRIVELNATGSGAGHGVGMCQWGALGRSRAGFTYEQIISAYFPGTQVIRAF